MRTLAKVGVVVIFLLGPLTFWIPFINILTFVIVGLFGLPIAWYVLFTLPEERYEELEIIKRIALATTDQLRHG
jgi:hypothetical protein